MIAAFAKGIFDSEIKVGFNLSYGDRVMYDKKNAEHMLEFLLDFNGRIQCYEKRYWVKFEITQGDKKVS